jgi:hypothetical protein
MASHDKRKDASKPATRGNMLATPAPRRPRDTALPQGMRDAGSLASQRVDERTKRRDTEVPQGPRDADSAGFQPPRVDEPTTSRHPWDTETPSGSRDAGPSGTRHPWTDDPRTPARQWDTETPSGSRDAGPSGTRHPWTDDARTPARQRDTVTPQGTRDADPTSSRRSGVDETPRQPSRASSTPASDTTPRRRPEIGAKALITDTRTNYQRRYGRLPASLALSRTLSRDAITPTIPSDDESTELP